MFRDSSVLQFSSKVLRNFSIIYVTSRRHVPRDRRLKIYSEKILNQEMQKCRSPNAAPNICGSSIWNLLHVTFPCIIGFRGEKKVVPPPPPPPPSRVCSSVTQL